MKRVTGTIKRFFSGSTRDLLLAFLLWRALLYLGAYLSSLIAAYEPDSPFAVPPASRWELFFGSWIHWDAKWYLNIVQDGYSYHGPGVQANVAFFPLYPLLVRLLKLALEWRLDTYCAAAVAGILISNLCALGATLLLCSLTRHELKQSGIDGSERQSLQTSLYFLFFPTSVFFASVYTEGLFLLLVIASFYCLRRGKFLLGGALGGAASLCRPTGILLLVPFAIEYLRRWKIRINKNILSFSFIVTGLALYALFLNIRFGEPLAFARVLSAPGWNKSITVFPFHTSLNRVLLFARQPHNVWLFLEIAYSVEGLLLSVLSLKYLPLSYSAYALITCLLPLAYSTWSMQRYVYAAFPTFMVLGFLGRKDKSFFLFMVISVFMLGISAVMWTHGLFLG